MSDTKAYCQLVTIKSIQIEDIPQQKINITCEQDIGLKFDHNARKDLKIYQKID